MELHRVPNSDSYLNPEKLFAIVDLDLEVQPTREDYLFPNTEAIFESLYQGTKVKQQEASKHRIWVTGLIYKEAYFLIPELQPIFDNYKVPLTFNNQPLQLENIYLALGKDMDGDANLKKNLTIACKRINYCTRLDCSSIDHLKSSWLTQFQSATNKEQKDELIYALLMIKPVKQYWEGKEGKKGKEPIPPKILPKPSPFNPPLKRLQEELTLKRLQEELTLEIGNFYSKEGEKLETEHHIPIFFKTLYQFVQ